MCLFDTGKKLQNKEDLKEMGQYTVGVSCLVETAIFRSTCASLVLSNGCFW